MESAPLIVVLKPLLLTSCFAYLVRTDGEGCWVLHLDRVELIVRIATVHEALLHFTQIFI
jgi:hypothetical protein